ncbi:MAG: hypothetical protein H2055_02235 [Sphingopyxis sp.]|nr:hypothetical protein [Sphingopyxis sp.]
MSAIRILGRKADRLLTATGGQYQRWLLKNLRAVDRYLIAIANAYGMALRGTGLLAALLLHASPGWAQSVQLPLEPMRAFQKQALKGALANVSTMPEGLARDQASTFVAYRLMMRGDCQQALPVMKRYLVEVADPVALGGLATGALTGRDPLCMRWVATRIETALAKAPLTDPQRAELRIRGQTMLMLAGQATRSYKMPTADFSELDIVPESVSQRELALEGLTVHIALGDAPRVRETLLINRLWDYRGTPLQIRLAKSLEKRATAEPKFLTSTGWIEVALVLLGAGERESAERLLETADVRYINGAGLVAEAALRQGDRNHTVWLIAQGEWVTKSKTVSRLMESWPAAFIPHIEQSKMLGTDFDAKLTLISYSEALDRAGFPDAAERAVRAALKIPDGDHYGRGRQAQALARLGDLEAARGLVRDAEQRPQIEDPYYVRLGVAKGAALSGNLDEAMMTIEAAPAGERDRILIDTLAAVSSIPSNLRDSLEQKLLRRAGSGQPLAVSPDAMAEFARGGLRSELLTAPILRLQRGRQNAQLVTRLADLARQSGHRANAMAIAELAETLLPDGPQADAELVALADLYWKLSSPEKATLIASRVSHQVGAVDALTRAFNPTRGENQPKLSFVTF